jgi:ADP-ribose pyrophosphatase YjhB (NUDIX family)
VFRHPEDGNMQLPKGTIEPGESPEAAVRRELLEESGIDYAGALQSLGTLDRECEAGVEGNTHRHPQLWHLFLMRAEGTLPETFEHTATAAPKKKAWCSCSAGSRPATPSTTSPCPTARPSSACARPCCWPPDRIRRHASARVTM